MPPCASIPSMKNLMISAILIAAMPSALAQTEPPPESLPTAEVIEARMPGVYSASVEIDSRLAEYPAILTALREDELGNMGEFAMMALEDHRSWTEDAPSWSWNPYFSDTGIAVTFAHPEVLSLNRNTSYYTGGAHPNQGSNPIVTRTDRLRPAGLADLLEDTVTDSAGLTVPISMKRWSVKPGWRHWRPNCQPFPVSRSYPIRQGMPRAALCSISIPMPSDPMPRVDMMFLFRFQCSRNTLLTPGPMYLTASPRTTS